MNKIQLLEKARELNITDVNSEMTNAEIQSMIDCSALAKAPVSSSDKPPVSSSKKYHGPLIVYPNGVEVAVKAIDAKAHKKRIFKESEISVEIKNLPKVN